MTPSVDHAVINVRYQMDEAVACFRSLGFTLTERGYHSLGSINHLMVFGRDYLELVGLPKGGNSVRREIADSPLGLNGLVFATEDACRLYQRLLEDRVPVDPPLVFDRPVAVDGIVHLASFTTVRLSAGYLSAGRVYFCEHKNRDLVWRPEWQQHANGATGLASFTIVAAEPSRQAAKYQQILQIDPHRLSADEYELVMEAFRIMFITPDSYRERYGSFGADPQGRTTFMGALGIRTASIAQAHNRLAAAPGQTIEYDGKRVVVAATTNFNTVLTFVP